ncbi:TolC family protein [Flavisolibacter ginsengisoli]|jgi:outer membrane protein|uniref:Outer membrane protein n=1 Tax=Flavisolibacter ginsengisoli DSM 18119 TaxID=1121884 RepID=A0A1M4SEX2_9BACT|nr:TolC family protein [Flavisolibacter ginsengisoli]SHE30746.1 outer membrane protein [Flavisolibacter ginsengisoli DSM 18119]
MKPVRKYGLLIIAFLLTAGINAQVKDSLKGWTLTDCINYAGDHNLQVRTLRLNGQAAEQELLLARGLKIPSLSFNLSNVFNHANNPVSDHNLVSQLTSSGVYALSSTLVIWNDNFINKTIEQRKLSMELANLQVEQSLNNMTLQITQYYLSILLDKENIQYFKDLVSTSEARVQQGEIFYKAGSMAKKELLQLQAQLASDRYLLVQIQNAIRKSLLLLKQSLQLPADLSFDIATPDTLVVIKNLLPFFEVRQAALNNFPDMKIGKISAEIASLDIVKASAGFKPMLSASGNLATGYSNVLTNAVAPKTGYFTQTGDNFYQRIGLTLSIPIFSNYVNKVNRAKATIAYKESLLNWQNDQLVLSQAVEQAYLQASNAIQSYRAASEQLNAATESYRISNEQFRLGAINSYDLLQQRNQYVQAVQAFTQAKYSAVLQQKIYEFYLGQPIRLQ